MRLRITQRAGMPRRHIARFPCAAVLAACAAVVISDAVEASTLSNVIEQAKKPIDEQEAVTRPATTHGGDASGTVSSPVVVVDAGYQDCYWPPVSLLPYTPVDYWPRERVIVQPDVQYGASSSSSIDGGHFGFKSLFILPADGVLTELSGAGVEFGISWSTLQAEAGVFWLEGNIDGGSPAYGALENPAEIAVDGRLRTPLTPILGINGFVGFRFGHLTWEYANPIYAVDPYGNGAELWNDSLNNISGYFGVGLRPLRMGRIDLGVDLGAGWRSYIGKTSEDFTNDVFEAGWFPQMSADFALRF